MDGSAQRPGPQVDIEAQLRTIKTHMPQTYQSIQAKAHQVGRAAYGWVRKSLAGEPNLFWAMERGHVVGTPFNRQDITADVAQHMVAFKCRSVVIWADPAQEGDSGAQ